MDEQKLSGAIDRLFRSYFTYCTAWTEDSLFNLLTSLHSLDDRLSAAYGRLMFDIPEYIALKALRNYFHHKGEVANVLRVKDLRIVPLITDLAYACLVSRHDCDLALGEVQLRFKKETEKAMREAFTYWGDVIDINPCIFNCVAKVYLALAERGLDSRTEEYIRFRKQIEFEVQNGFPHTVTGAMATRPGDIGKVHEVMLRLYNSRSN